MHARVSGLADFLATDEIDAIRLGRDIVGQAQLAQARPGPTMAADDPVHDPEELLGVPAADLRTVFDPREVIGRVVDGSRFDEFKPLYGPSLVTGWASIHGYPSGILANHRGILFSRGGQQGDPVHPAREPGRHSPCCSFRTPPATWSGRTTSSAGSSKTGRR